MSFIFSLRLCTLLRDYWTVSVNGLSEPKALQVVQGMPGMSRESEGQVRAGTVYHLLCFFLETPERSRCVTAAITASVIETGAVADDTARVKVKPMATVASR